MRTTKKQFDLYKKSANRWLLKFGLISWKVFFEHINNDMDAIATCTADPPGRVALFSFTRTIGVNEGLTNKRIEQVGFHEACELLLAPLIIACQDTETREDEIDSIRHGIIRRLEHVIFGRQQI